MGGPEFRWPVGTYVNNDRFHNIMMAMETKVTADGVKVTPVKGTPAEEAELERSYKHLCTLRDEVIAMGVMPPIDKWDELNPNLSAHTC